MTDGRTFDVYLTGAKDKSPSTQMRLTTSIATRYRVAAPAVAAVFEGIPCRVAAGLGAREAEALVNALATMGATARLAPRGAPFGAGSPETGTTAMSSDEFATTPDRKDGRITLKSADIKVPSVVDVSEPIEFAEPGPEARTGVRGPDTIRCPIHGLVYNRKTASGCVKCLAPARALARNLRDESQGPLSNPLSNPSSSPLSNPSSNPASPFSLAGSSFRDDPVRRAFWGLAVALLAGFLPAAYYARWSNRDTLLALRVRQAEISALPATKESLARFDELDAAVDVAHRRGAGRALLIWIVGTGIAGAVWVRLSRPANRESADAPDVQ